MADDSRIRWSGLPLPGVPDWTLEQAYAGQGPCESCGRNTTLRPDPMVGQSSCRPCWERLMFGDENDG